MIIKGSTSMKQKTLTVIFDFDGTIADSIPIFLKIFNKLAREYGIKQISEEEMPHLKNLTTRELIHYLGIPFYKIPFFIRKAQRDIKYGTELSNPITHMVQVLTLLHKDHKLGIISSNSEDNIHLFLQKHDIDFFDFVINQNNLFGKDRALKNCLKKLSLPTDEVIYIGDETRDIEAARKAGVKIISVTWGFNSEDILRKLNPDFIVKEPKDLIRIIKQSFLTIS